jgi:low affinity Fe/Cu permease
MAGPPARPGAARAGLTGSTAVAAAGRGHLVLPQTFAGGHTDAGGRSDWDHHTVVTQCEEEFGMPNHQVNTFQASEVGQRHQHRHRRTAVGRGEHLGRQQFHERIGDSNAAEQTARNVRRYRDCINPDCEAHMSKWFQSFALLAAEVVGTPAAFLLACLTVLVWGGLGPIMQFSDTWQLLINTGTSIVTFLVVFLIQYAQNRDTRAIRLKLDELLRAAEGARPALIDLDRLADEQIERLEQELHEWRRQTPRRRQLMD